MVGIQKLLLARLVLFIVVFGMTCSMGEKDKPGFANEPGFARLAEGEGSFRAIVYDERNQYALKEFSFFGHTSVGGVRRETDDSVTRFELSKIKELKVLKAHFDSKRFGDKDYLLAEVTSKTGAITSDLLVPKKLIICGVDEKSGLEKSWFLQKIDRFVVQGPTPLVLPSIPSALSTQVASVATAAPLAPPAESVQQQAPVQQVPTAGSREQTKRTYTPPKENKWDVFYKQNQIPETNQETAQERRGISGAFIAVIDAIIDFVKALVNGALKFFR